MDINLIRQTLNSPGWEDIEEMLKEKITDLRLARNVSRKKAYADIAIEVMSKARAANKIMAVLKKLERIKNSTEITKQSYK